MGKNLNQKAWLEFERLDRQRQEASLDTEPPLAEFERAAEYDDDRWTKKDDAAAEHMARIAAEVRYFMGVK
ncbi:UNVERIFIED_ORG: hypothetical protein ABIC54_004432 [Burkholderia sp. 1263]